jgi:hypothetical protein
VRKAYGPVDGVADLLADALARITAAWRDDPHDRFRQHWRLNNRRSLRKENPEAEAAWQRDVTPIAKRWREAIDAEDSEVLPPVGGRPGSSRKRLRRCMEGLRSTRGRAAISPQPKAGARHLRALQQNPREWGCSDMKEEQTSTTCDICGSASIVGERVLQQLQRANFTTSSRPTLANNAEGIWSRWYSAPNRIPSHSSSLNRPTRSSMPALNHCGVWPTLHGLSNRCRRSTSLALNVGKPSCLSTRRLPIRAGMAGPKTSSRSTTTTVPSLSRHVVVCPGSE